MSPWHAVLCKPRREALAETNLGNQGYEVYLPRMTGLRRRSGRWEQRIEPLFPRYLFLNEGDGGRALAPVHSTLTRKGIFLTICARRAKETTMSRIHEVATITSKGQITLPKPIRQALGVDSGGKVAFDFNGKAVTVTRAEPGEHADPAISRFLALLERDLARGKNVTALPAGLARSLQQAKKRRVDLPEEIEGDVNL